MAARRKRRTKAEMGALDEKIVAMVREQKPMTVRQAFYRAVSKAAIPKTEQGYKTIGRRIVALRRLGRMPYSWITDNTRWVRKGDSYDSLGEMLDITQSSYRRAIWTDQPCRVEIWLEKDALSGVLFDVTNPWDVELHVTRGYPSETYLHSCAENMAYAGKPTHIYYFGDRDPSGVDIPVKVERALRDFAPEVELTFTVAAVTESQIERYGLQTRPTKKSDSRAKNFKGESVEVDAIEPDDLRWICRTCIEKHIDHDRLEKLKAIEASERETVRRIASGFAA